MFKSIRVDYLNVFCGLSDIHDLVFVVKKKNLDIVLVVCTYSIVTIRFLVPDTRGCGF